MSRLAIKDIDLSMKVFFKIFLMHINMMFEPIFEELLPSLIWHFQNMYFECINWFFRWYIIWNALTDSSDGK